MKKSAGIWALKSALWLLLILILLLLIVLPLVTSILVNNLPNVPPSFSKYLRGIEILQTYMMQFLTAAWFFYVGSCFASFLNVVAWRIPRGRNILGSSKCPHCDKKLSFKDNIPIVGWLKNSGRCRYCGVAISPRYVLVEVLLGSIFLAIVMLTLFTGGINLPLRCVDAGKGFERVLFDPQWDLIQILANHLTLISFLFTFALIRLEDKRIPASIIAFGVLFGLTYTFAFPAVQVVNWRNPSTEVAGFVTFELDQVLTVVIGTAVGALLGWILDIVELQASFSSVWSLGLCGLFLGWQSAVSICMITLVLQILFAVAPIGSFKFCGLNRPALILAGTILHLSLWRVFSMAAGYWPSHDSSLIQIVIQFVAIATLVGLNYRLNRKITTPIALL